MRWRLGDAGYTGPSATPEVSYGYNTVPNCFGQLIAVTSGSTTQSVQSCDSLGRVTASHQTTNGVPYDFGYAWNLQDSKTSESRQSGRTLTFGYNAAGRPLSAVGQRGGVSTTYASNMQYAPHGAWTSASIGQVKASRGYDSNLRTTRVIVKVGAFPLIDLAYTYFGNDNMWRQTINDGTPVRTQQYGYNMKNELETASEQGVWSQTYTYGQYGNRALVAGSYAPQTIGQRRRLRGARIRTASSLIIGGWMQSTMRPGK